jgi:hypothetical protein
MVLGRRSNLLEEEATYHLEFKGKFYLKEKVLSGLWQAKKRELFLPKSHFTRRIYRCNRLPS